MSIEEIKESFINFIDQVNQDYFLNIEILDSKWEDEDDMDVWEFTTTNIPQSRVVYLSTLFSGLRPYQLYDRNLALLISNMIPPYDAFNDIYEQFLEIPGAHPDVGVTPEGHLTWGFSVDE